MLSEEGKLVVPRIILLLPRLFLGVIFARAVYPKLTMHAPGFAAVLPGFLQHELPDAHPLYQAFAQAVVLPHAAVFAMLVIVGELYVALAMLFGITTRLAACVAVFLLLNYMLAKGMNLWSPASNDAADIILAVVVALGAAGRVWGADRALAQRWPRVPLW